MSPSIFSLPPVQALKRSSSPRCMAAQSAADAVRVQLGLSATPSWRVAAPFSQIVY